MTDRAKKLLLVVVAAIAAVIVICWMWPEGKAQQGESAVVDQQPQPPANRPLILSTEEMLNRANSESAGGQPSGVPPGEGVDRARPPKTHATGGADAAAALKLYQQGQKLADAGKLVEARTALSEALFSNKLAPAKAASARKVLTSLAENTLFSPAFNRNDPYLSRYTVKAGDKLSLVERQMELHVPTQIICKINRIDDPNVIRAGQTLKMIKGPFHAVISLSNFSMDIYLHRKGLPYIFIKRMRVGVGKEGITPVGSWRVSVIGPPRRASCPC